MPTPIGPSPLRIDTGLDPRVLREGGIMPQLESGTNVPPAEQPSTSHLDALLAAHTLEDFIDDELRPLVVAVEILGPAQFRKVLEKTVAEMRVWAEQNPRAARPLGRAARVLDETKNLHELLLMYRWALLQG